MTGRRAAHAGPGAGEPREGSSEKAGSQGLQGFTGCARHRYMTWHVDPIEGCVPRARALFFSCVLEGYFPVVTSQSFG